MFHLLYSHHHKYADSCRTQRHNEDERHSLLEKYIPLTLLKGFQKGYSRFYCKRELETEQNCNILTPTLMAISVVSSPFCSTGVPGAHSVGWWLLYHILSPTSLISKLTDFLSSLSYVIVQSPSQYFAITGHRDVSLLLSLEWHVWLSSSGNNCRAVHRSFSSGASVYDCTTGFYLVPYCQPSPPTPMEYATSASLEWHVWPGRRSIYNNHPLIIFQNSTCGIFFTSVSITLTCIFLRTIFQDNNNWKHKRNYLNHSKTKSYLEGDFLLM